MEVVLSRSAPEAIETALLAVPITGAQTDPVWKRLQLATGGWLGRLARQEGFEGRAEERLLLTGPGLTARGTKGLRAERLLLVGARTELAPAEVGLAVAAARAARWAEGHQLRDWALWVPALEDLPAATALRRAVTGALSGSYVWRGWRRPRAGGPGASRPSGRCQLLWTGEGARPALSWARAAAGALVLARDLVNSAPNLLTPDVFARRARAEARARGLEVEVWNPERLKRERCHLLLAVARGSAAPPRLVWLRHRPRRGRPRGRLALVGKGVTFDSGGLGLKPHAGQLDMKSDMAGAASVLGVLCAAAELDLPWVLDGWLPLAENMPDGGAFRPGDVLTSRSGLTVEVHHPDAEGRLLLADALDLACGLGPDRVLDLATLTGACKAALGPNMAGLFGTDEVWAGEWQAAGERVGEEIWRLPLNPSLASTLRSDSADLRNSGARFGGAIAAALFLKEFVGDTPWLHLDMAGPAYLDKEHGLHPRGGTGFGVLSLLELLSGD